MYRIDLLDNGYLLVNLKGFAMGFGSKFFSTIEELAGFLINNVGEHAREVAKEYVLVEK